MCTASLRALKLASPSTTSDSYCELTFARAFAPAHAESKRPGSCRACNTAFFHQIYIH